MLQLQQPCSLSVGLLLRPSEVTLPPRLQEQGCYPWPRTWGWGWGQGGSIAAKLVLEDGICWPTPHARTNPSWSRRQHIQPERILLQNSLLGLDLLAIRTRGLSNPSHAEGRCLPHNYIFKAGHLSYFTNSQLEGSLISGWILCRVSSTDLDVDDLCVIFETRNWYWLYVLISASQVNKLCEAFFFKTFGLWRMGIFMRYISQIGEYGEGWNTNIVIRIVFLQYSHVEDLISATSECDCIWETGTLKRCLS